ncbi:hypothetical protein JCM10212_001005, partial [Sporobolomyces blumeae]
LNYADAVGLDSTDYTLLVYAFYADRAQSILESGLYEPKTDDENELDENLVRLSTDFTWTCPNQEAALATAAKNNKVYLGEFDLGIKAASNAYYSLCEGKVGHEDDISVVFNTPSTGSLSSAQKSLVSEVQARWAAFAQTGNPNPTGSSSSSSQYATWPALSSSSGSGIQVLALGKSSDGLGVVVNSQRTEACALYASA